LAPAAEHSTPVPFGETIDPFLEEIRDVVEFDELNCKGSGLPLTLAYYLNASEPKVIKRRTIPDTHHEPILSKPPFIADILRILPSSRAEGYAQKEGLKNTAFSEKSIPALYFIFDFVISGKIRRGSDRSWKW